MVTINDVAKLAGVSRGTVSNVINHVKVRPEYQEKVEQAIKDLGYVPNAYARSLKSNRTHTVALILPTVWFPFFSKLTNDMEQELRRRGYRLGLASSSKTAGVILPRTGLDALLDRVVDGNQITRSKPDPEVFLRAAQLLELPPEDCAGVDDALAGVESARTAGMTAAAIGPAALAGAGDWNLECLSRLLDLCPPLEGGRDL